MCRYTATEPIGLLTKELPMKLLLLLAALTLSGQTRVSLDQIRNWQQVRNPNSSGTAIAISQLQIPPGTMEIWRWSTEEPYRNYRTGTVLAQQPPVLIVCGEPVSSFTEWHRVELNEVQK
jgi:hypothetical protein